MKKGLINLFIGIICLGGLTGCNVNIKKDYEYTMNIEKAPIVAHLQEDENKEVIVAHCKRGGSLLNYYIELPEMEEGFEIPTKLIAKDTVKTLKTTIVNEKGKSEKVSDHGYKFIKWVEE